MFSWFLLSGMAAALGTSIALAAWQLAQPRQQLARIEPTQVGLAYADITFRARGEPLSIAAWHIPAPGATQAVIIAYDSGRCHDRAFAINSLDLAAHLVRSGFSVLMLDLHDHNADDSAPTIYGIRERRELLGAVDWLLAQGYVAGSIGVLGTSIGAVAGIGAANQELAIGALIIDSTCADVLIMTRHFFRHFSTLPLYFLPDGRLLNRNDLTQQRSAELLRLIDRRPVQILHAKGAQLVPVERSSALVRPGDTELWVADCASHLGAFGVNPHIYRQQVSRFFCRALASQPVSHATAHDAYDASWRPRTSFEAVRR